MFFSWVSIHYQAIPLADLPRAHLIEDEDDDEDENDPHKKSPDIHTSGLFNVAISSKARRSYLRDLIDHFDVNDVAIDYGHLFVLAVIGRVVIDGRIVSIIGRIIGIDRVRIIVAYEIHRHPDDDVAPANVVIPCPAKSWSKSQPNQVITIPVGAPEIAPPKETTMVEPAAVSEVIRAEGAMACPLTVRNLRQPLAHQTLR
jgi:hypothetical protein